jgi:hypothetical protein
VFIAKKDGTIDATAPLIWDFDQISTITAYPIDAEVLTVKGGKFTTKANMGQASDSYMQRGILVSRSNTVIDGLTHLITGEGAQGAAYTGFLYFEMCANVTVKNSTLSGHKVYQNNGVDKGTYDINANRTVNLNVLDCKQQNDIYDAAYWGIFTSNFSKNIKLDGVKFSRVDAHQGVYNATILNSELGHQRVSIIGSGTLKIENTKIKAQHFIYLRDDYGSSWEGNVIISNCTFTPTNQTNSQIIHTNNDGKWDYKYNCTMPETITITGLTIDASVNSGKPYLVYTVNLTGSYPYPLTNTITISGGNLSTPYRMSTRASGITIK